MTLDYRPPDREPMPAWGRFMLGALCGMCGSCVLTYIAGGFGDRRAITSFAIIGFLSLLSSVAAGVFHYWFYTGLLVAAGFILIAVGGLAHLNIGWHG